MTLLVNSTMEEYYPLEHLQTIWNAIGSLHMKYLEMEESPQKLTTRHELEGIIREFLSFAPHRSKFMFPETANVLYRSANTKKDFSGYKAAVGWNAIAMYAANLWNQPWRTEYKQIKLYSGFYKHQIDANLDAADLIFELMGYRSDDCEVLSLDGPICPDRVVGVSQDALVAYVECQVLKAIWEEVSSSFKITWLDVLEFRQSHVANEKQSIQALNYLCHERQFHHHTRSHSQGTDVRYCNASSTLPTNHSFPPLPLQSLLPLHCTYNNGYYPNNYPIYASAAPHLHYQYLQNVAPMYAHTAKPALYTNGYSNPIQPTPQVCPTAQLIEVESQHCNEPSKSPSSNNEESWEYVYKDLENQGYSKDLGERGDVLNNPLDKKTKATSKEAKKVKSHAVDKMLGYLNLNDKKTHTLPSNSENVYTNNVLETKSNNNSSGSRINNLKTKLSKTTVTSSLNNQSEDKTSSTASSDMLLKWQCASCTFLNDRKYNVCEICAKSKIVVKDDMEIGGSQCSHCTLVNPKNNINCSACSSSLKGSSTYI